ncbi:MFS-type transporter SLC18B1-like [Babylonia areolata]|uniref:MFS-type transporter SLC18B1-like n=1 Tax=Babylonia areolata TaxID=304850 RepID=UPI003FD31E3B
MERTGSSQASPQPNDQSFPFRQGTDHNQVINKDVTPEEEEEKEEANSGATRENKDQQPSDDKDENQPASFSFRRLPSHKKWTMVAMAFANFAASTCFSLLAPFFPNEASKKGATQTVTGLIFSTFELWIFVSSPVYGYFLTRIGSRFMFLSGLFTCGVCAVLFGLLDQSPPGTVFVAMCFLVRTVEALGASAFITASFAIIANEFPTHVSTVFGTLETFSGLGFMLGPPLGGFLYELGGFGVPFWVLGSLLVLCAVLIVLLLPRHQDQPRPKKGSVLRLLTNPLVLVTIITTIAGSFCLGFLDPTLAPHLEQFDLSTAVVGLVFLVASAVYALTAPLWGYLSDNKGLSFTLVVAGNLVACVSFLLLGPSPLLPFLKHELWLVIVSLSLAGLGIGAALNCTLKCLVVGARQEGFEDNLDTFGLISGLFNSAFSLGTFIGPTVGSVIVEYYGFDWASTVDAAIFFYRSVACSEVTVTVGDDGASTVVKTSSGAEPNPLV